MQKSILTFAVLSALAGGAVAQSTATIYGVMDLGILHRDNGAVAGDVLSLTSGIQSSSRLGFKGTEDLGGGVSALFVMESNLSPDATSASATLGSRISYVGLKSGMGSLLMGRMETPVYAVYSSLDPFGRGLTGDMSSMFTIGGTGSSGTRTNNTINYQTPSMGGFKGQFAYTLGEVAGDDNRGREYGLSVGYANGPIAAYFAHQNANSSTAAPAAIVNFKTNVLGGTYNFGMLKAHLAYGDNKDNLATNVVDTNSWLVGVSAPFGPHTVMADYIQKHNSVGANRDADMISASYTYAFSKRTNLYASYARTGNESAGTTNVAVAGATDTKLAFGLRHKF